MPSRKGESYFSPEHMLKKSHSPLFIATALAVAMPANAQTSDGCGYSFMLLPDGNCLNLDYTSILGASRRNVDQANAQYQELFDANVTLEVIYSQYPLLDNETEDEREARLDNLFATKQMRDEIAAIGQNIEDRLYPFHVESMSIVGRAFR